MKCGKKTFTYSADTHMNPDLVNKMYTDGTIGEGRRDALLNFPWDADLILHEAGVPPIHTPIEILASLSPDIKNRLYLVHVTPKTIPANSGLKVAHAGQTIRLEVPENEHHFAVQALNLFRRISLLSACFQTMVSIDIYSSLYLCLIMEFIHCRIKHCRYFKGLRSNDINRGR